MFNDPKSRFGVDLVPEYRVAPVSCDYDLTVSDLSGSITGTSPANGPYLVIPNVPSFSGMSLRWLANIFAHGVGQTATCIALSVGDCVDVRGYTMRFEGTYADGKYAAEELTSGLLQWLRAGEARLDVPSFRILIEQTLKPTAPELEPLSGWLQQTWHAGL